MRYEACHSLLAFDLSGTTTVSRVKALPLVLGSCVPVAIAQDRKL